MKTHITGDVARAASFIRAGELVAFPTETVYGLGADALNRSAVERIFAAKNRPADNPVIVHVGSAEAVADVAAEISRSAAAFMRAFFPGPLTLVLPRRQNVPDIVSAGLPTVGVRMPAHATALALIRAAGRPIAAPSANVSGRPSPTAWRAVEEDLGGRIACILTGEPVRVGIESTVVDCTGDVPAVLRPGGISLEKLKEIVPATLATGARPDDASRSPGTRHRHYAPAARVVLVDDPLEIRNPGGTGYIGLDPAPDPAAFAAHVHAADLEDYAERLFAFFRACDRSGIGVIHCQRVGSGGIGAAILDRLQRAARR